jgi:hypothetical protein
VLAEYLRNIQPSFPEYQPTRGFYNHGWLIGDEQAISAVTQARLDAMLEIAPQGAAGASATSSTSTTASPTTTTEAPATGTEAATPPNTEATPPANPETTP